MTEIKSEPIVGPVVDTEWVGAGEMIATVEGPDGATWKETYTFVEAEKLGE